MKRFHVHVAVENLDESIRFYSTVFGVDPSVVQSDYAKWMLEDPRLNFAISQRGRTPGVNHLGFQVDSTAELIGLRQQLVDADEGMVEQADTSCCYARSDKYWVKDPSGIAWETFHSLGTVPVYGEEEKVEESACRVPAAKVEPARACCA